MGAHPPLIPAAFVASVDHLGTVSEDMRRSKTRLAVNAWKMRENNEGHGAPNNEAHILVTYFYELGLAR